VDLGRAQFELLLEAGPQLRQLGWDVRPLGAPTIVIQAWRVIRPPAGHLEQGLHLVTSAVRRDPENPLSTLKTTSRADYVHARIEARRAGADDALFLTIEVVIADKPDSATPGDSAMGGMGY
jgi:branched-subunit amino acid aminotransferase/4-amino-4-deoxychorismate lyase